MHVPFCKPPLRKRTVNTVQVTSKWMLPNVKIFSSNSSTDFNKTKNKTPQTNPHHHLVPTDKSSYSFFWIIYFKPSYRIYRCGIGVPHSQPQANDSCLGESCFDSDIRPNSMPHRRNSNQVGPRSMLPMGSRTNCRCDMTWNCLRMTAFVRTCHEVLVSSPPQSALSLYYGPSRII